MCPFHGWVYNLDGTLRGAARPRSFPELDKTEFGLMPLDLEIWQGFIFIRFRKGPQPSVAELMKPFEEEISHYDIAGMVPATGIWTQRSPVNWKSVRDVDNEGYHVAMAHPALQDLYGATYFDEPFVDGVSRSFATYNPHAGRRWSVRNYVKIAPVPERLPEYLRRAWLYYGLFPNGALALTPESVQFYQEFPLSTGETLLRGAVYRYPEESRRQKLARYLAMRIDRETQEEDIQLTVWSNESMLSNAFAGLLPVRPRIWRAHPSRPSAAAGAGARPRGGARREGHLGPQRRAFVARPGCLRGPQADQTTAWRRTRRAAAAASPDSRARRRRRGRYPAGTPSPAEVPR